MKTMSEKIFVELLAAVLLTTVSFAYAQQPKKIPRIGYLGGASLAAIPERIEAFREGLGALGYVEGENFVIEFRWAEGKLDRIPALASELVRLKVDVIVTAGPQVTRAAKVATTMIPIVMATDPDPVANGFVVSLARPGGNVTGLSTFLPELSGKRLELLKETIPKLSRVALFGTSTRPGSAQSLKEAQTTANAFDVKIHKLDVLSPKDISPAFRTATKEHADAGIWLVAGSFAVTQRSEIVDLAAKSRLPLIYDRREFVEDGGLMTYSVSATDLHRRAATYVDKILKGVKPADLPVERPTKFEFIVNLKSAKQIGLTIPPNVLVRADRVIK